MVPVQGYPQVRWRYGYLYPLVNPMTPLPPNRPQEAIAFATMAMLVSLSVVTPFSVIVSVTPGVTPSL